MSVDPAVLAFGNAQEFKDRYDRPLEFHLANPQNLNSYSYVTNNPLKYVDPDGEILVPLLALLVVGGILFNNIDAVQAPSTDILNQSNVPETKEFAELAIPAYDNLSRGQQLGVNLMFLGVANSAEKKIAKVTQREINMIIRSADDAFNQAASGLRNSGFLNNYLGKSTGELKKGINSLENVIKLHIDKLNNPTKYIDNIENRSQQYINGLMNKWKKDVFNNKEKQNILNGILNNLK